MDESNADDAAGYSSLQPPPPAPDVGCSHRGYSLASTEPGIVTSTDVKSPEDDHLSEDGK